MPNLAKVRIGVEKKVQKAIDSIIAVGEIQRAYAHLTDDEVEHIRSVLNGYLVNAIGSLQAQKEKAVTEFKLSEDGKE